MKDLYLHIGHHKTGTTCIQHFLAGNRSQLANDGYLYPRTGELDQAHHLLAISVNKNKDFIQILDKSAEEYWSDLFFEADQSGCNKVIVSSEEFSNNINSDSIEEIKQYTENKFNVRVILYIRRIDELVQSIYKQLVKFYGVRCELPFDINAPYVVNNIDFYSKINLWGDVFGKDRITLRIFEIGILRHNPVYDFLSTVGYSGDLLDPNLTEIKKNESLSIKYTEILRYINGKFDLSKEIHELIVSLFLALSKTEKENFSYLSLEERENLINLSLPHYKKLVAEFLPEHNHMMYESIPCDKATWQGSFDTLADANLMIQSAIQDYLDGLPSDFPDKDYVFKFPSWRSNSPLENQLIQNGGSLSGVCNICCKTVEFDFRKNLRDSGICRNCLSMNRDRQIAYIVKKVLQIEPTTSICAEHYENIRVLQIGHMNKFGDIFSESQIVKTIFNTESDSGSFIGGIRCEDITRLTFSNKSFDFILTSDILEHVNRYESALSEIARVLKPGGAHIFCVPFDAHNHLNARYCFGYPNNESIWPNKQYHFDDDGTPIPLYQIFGYELFIDCAKHGLETEAHFINAPAHGIIGSNALVFVSRKTSYDL